MKKAVISLLLLCSTAFGQRIQDQPDLLLDAIENPALIRIPVADIQGGGFGTGRDVGVDVLSKLGQSAIISENGHGLNSGQIGYPLVGTSLYNEGTPSEPTGVLLGVPDTDTVRVAPAGSFAVLAVNLIDVGAAYDPAISGYDLYWDTAQAKYTNARPLATDDLNGTVLHVVHVGTTTFTAIVQPKRPARWGTVVVHRADGSTDSYVPSAANANARGDALIAAINSLQASTVSDLPGDVLVMERGALYRLDDQAFADKDGCVIDGNGAVIMDRDGNYTNVMQFAGSDNLTIKNLSIIGSTSTLDDLTATTNPGSGKGLRINTSNNVLVKNVRVNWHCGLAGALAEFPLNVQAHGIFLQDCDDIVLESVEVSHNGRYGIEVRECARMAFRDIVGNRNGRQIINIINDSTNPERVQISDVTGIGDENHDDLLLPGCPGISIGSDTFWVNSRADISNVNLTWDNIDHDTSSLGGTYTMVKITDYEYVSIDNMTLRQKDTNAGTIEVFALLFQNCEQVHIDTLKTDASIRNFQAKRIENFTLMNSQINRLQRNTYCTLGLEADRAIVRGCEFFFSDFALDFVTVAGNYREVVGNTFHGNSVVNHHVFRDTDDITLAKGKLRIEDNELDLCSYADTAAKIYEIETGGVVEFGDGDDTPSVTRGVLEYETANTGSTTIVDFDDGYDGQEIRITIADAFTNVQDNAAIQLSGSTDFTPGSGGGKITLRRRGGVWQEVSRVQY